METVLENLDTLAQRYGLSSPVLLQLAKKHRETCPSLVQMGTIYLMSPAEMSSLFLQVRSRGTTTRLNCSSAAKKTAAKVKAGLVLLRAQEAQTVTQAQTVEEVKALAATSR